MKMRAVMTGRKGRTDLQRRADEADCDLYRVICRVERMYDEIKGARGERITNLHKSLQDLRNARSGIRNFMHEDDRERTRGW